MVGGCIDNINVDDYLNELQGWHLMVEFACELKYLSHCSSVCSFQLHLLNESNGNFWRVVWCLHALASKDNFFPPKCFLLTILQRNAWPWQLAIHATWLGAWRGEAKAENRKKKKKYMTYLYVCVKELRKPWQNVRSSWSRWLDFDASNLYNFLLS